MYSLSLSRGRRLASALYAKVVKKVRRFIRRATIEIGPAWRQTEEERDTREKKHDPKKGFSKKEWFFNDCVCVWRNRRVNLTLDRHRCIFGMGREILALNSRSYRCCIKSRISIKTSRNYNFLCITSDVSDTVLDSIPKMAIYGR